MALRKYLTEFIGTFLFVFAVLGIVASGAKTVPTALGVGSALMVAVFASGHVSGGHVNPSVSIAAWLRGALPVSDLVPYIVAQLLGAAAAFGTGFGLWHHKYCEATALDLGGNVWPAFLAELVFTFALCYVVLHTATSKDIDGNSFYGLAIGFTVTAGVVAVGAISGASFNPAVTLGLMLGGFFSWKFLWVYLTAEIVGAVAAAVAYKAVTAEAQTVDRT